MTDGPAVVIVDSTGTDIAKVLAASTAAVATDKALVVALSPNNTIALPTGSATLAEQQVQSASLSIIDDWDESDRAKVNIIVGQAGVAAGTGVDGATVQRVSLATNVPLPAGANSIGTLGANSGVDIGDVTINNAAGASAVNIQDGGNSITVDGPLTDAQLRATPVPISGTVTGGGGTQYTEGATTDPATGTAILGRYFGDGAFRAVAISSVQSLMVDGSSATQPISAASLPLPTGASTAANQASGNSSLATIVSQTALLALESGGNLAAAAASLSVLDDWDETDRAKVNVIVGQAGITAGAGAVAANTPRMTHASDDPVVTALQIIDDWDETDRAKVNVIVGQAGITAGAGAVAASTPRVTHASDDPVTVALQIIDDWDESDRAKVNPIAGQAGVQGASGVVNALTQRVVLATDVALPAGTNGIGKLTANSGVDIGDVDVTSINETVATFDHGRKSSIGTSAVQINSSSLSLTKGMTVKASRNNTAPIYIGNSDVTADSADATDGFELYAGESIHVPASNQNAIYAISTAASQKAFYVVA